MAQTRVMAVEMTRNGQMFGDVGSRETYFFFKMGDMIIYFMLMEMIP